jgi:glycosyltransferase involved in cell wall biosynthesis
MNNSWVTACIPTYKCTPYLRQAVVSLLNQTYPYVRIIVINDGDSRAPWSVLSDIIDPRLIRFDLKHNRGPYFCLAIALEATDDKFFLVQDADDWSAPQRLACLLRLIASDRADYAFSTLAQFSNLGNGGISINSPMFSVVRDTLPSPDFKCRIPHHGLFRVSALRMLGGYFGGYKFGYDEFITNILLLSGTVSWSPDHLYWRRLRSDSLTRRADTGMASAARKAMRARLGNLYQEIYGDYVAFLGRHLSGEDFLKRVRSRVQASRGPGDEQRIKSEAARLRDVMRVEAERYQISTALRSARSGGNGQATF